jgi:hypothetical protein
LSNPILLSAQNIICNRWFGDNERGLATALGGLSIPVGSVAAFIQTGIVFAGIQEDDANANEATISAMNSLLW